MPLLFAVASKTSTPLSRALNDETGADLEEVPAVPVVGVMVNGTAEEEGWQDEGGRRLHSTLTGVALVSAAVGARSIVAALKIVSDSTLGGYDEARTTGS